MSVFVARWQKGKSKALVAEELGTSERTVGRALESAGSAFADLAPDVTRDSTHSHQTRRS